MTLALEVSILLIFDCTNLTLLAIGELYGIEKIDRLLLGVLGGIALTQAFLKDHVHVDTSDRLGSDFAVLMARRCLVVAGDNSGIFARRIYCDFAAVDADEMAVGTRYC